MFNVKIVTEDGEAVYFDCRPDEDIVSASLRQDIYLMTSCREGGCATCKGLCTEGEYAMGKFSVQALPPEEEEEGYVLLCRCYPTSDLEIEVPYTYDRISFSADELCFDAEIVELAPMSCNVVKLCLRKLGVDQSVRLESGQYYDLEIPGTGVSRSYSPANTANHNGELEFLIRIVDNGKFSVYLQRDAKVGHVIRAKGSLGVFGLRENGFTPRYFVAGGTGLAPIMSMVRRMHEWSEPQPCVIYFGVNTEQEVFYAEQVKALEQAMSTLSVHICVWQAGEGWRGEKGSVVDILRRDLLDTGIKPDLYLCGPPGMVDATYQVCAQVGIPRDKIYLEKFLPSAA